ncbi:MAG TPA: hypothetical protein VEZ38_19460, partial [Paenibacillus sp.]|nr:hypothetical protein [Paenibacillus sp.]
MDIGRAMRAAVGEAATTASEAKAVELRPGQVVRGVVVQQLPDNEAVLNVGGGLVRAKLESPIPVGQAAVFQVQPDAGSQVAVLRTLAAATTEVVAETFVDVLKSFGMKDTPANRAVVRVLHEEGAPMSRATNAAVAAAVEALSPSPGEADALLRAAATAVKRGLPVTAETVRALHTAMHGPSATELHRALEAGAREALASPQASPAAKQAAVRLLEVLQRADALVGEALRPQPDPAGAARAAAAPSAGVAPSAAP